MSNPFDKFDQEPNPFDKFDAKPKVTPSTGSRVQAGIAGINKGFFADLVGLPVDTVANVLDLGKANVGGVMNAAADGLRSINALPKVRERLMDWAPEVNMDRSGVIGSSQWLEKQYNNVGLGQAINNPNPGDPVSRIAHMGGRVAGASVFPNPKAAIPISQNIANMAKGGVAGLAAGSVGEVNPDAAGLAGMMPQALMMMGSAATRRAVRGGEAGRQDMENRIAALKAGGVDDPSVGLASGSKFFQGIENLAAQTPGSVGLYDAARIKNMAGMQAKTEAIRDAASRQYGPAVAGTAMQADVKKVFHDRVSETYRRLDEKFSAKVPKDRRFPIPETLKSLGEATAVNLLAPNTTGSFVQPRIGTLKGNILADSTDTIPIMYGSYQANKGLPLNAIRAIRTDIGNEAASRAIFGTPEQADFKSIYGGLSRDMQGAAKITDLGAGPQPSNIGPAQAALNRSNRFYSKSMERADDLSPIVNKSTPEQAYDSIVSSLKSGGTLYSKMRNAVTPETRSKILATAIDEMGGATPGNQNAPGDVWSPKTFLTNYNKIYNDGGGKEMFKRLPGGEKMANDLSAIAKAADMLGDSAKVWSNPSGTGAAFSARATLGTLTIGTFVSPVIAGTTAASLGLVNQASKRLLLNPKFVHWLAKVPDIPPQQAKLHAQRLMSAALMTNDEQFQSDVTQYLEAVGDGLDQEQDGR